MLHRFKYSTCPNGASLYIEKSQAFKNDWNPFLSFVFHNGWLQNHCWLSAKGMVPNFVVFVSALLPICCHIGWGMPYLCIFVEEVATLLGSSTYKWVWKLVCGQNLNISNDQVKVAAKNINAKFFACELWVKRVGTFGVVLYRNQWPVNFILHSSELHIDSSIRYENALYRNCFLNCYIVKRILISFNCFSEYSSCTTELVKLLTSCLTAIKNMLLSTAKMYMKDPVKIYLVY